MTLLNQERINELNKFLLNLENPDNTMDVMVDRVDINALTVMHNYSEAISIVQHKTSIPSGDIITCAMIIGYLIKSHTDRLDMTNMLGEQK